MFKVNETYSQKNSTGPTQNLKNWGETVKNKKLLRKIIFRKFYLTPIK